MSVELYENDYIMNPANIYSGCWLFTIFGWLNIQFQNSEKPKTFHTSYTYFFGETVKMTDDLCLLQPLVLILIIITTSSQILE